MRTTRSFTGQSGFRRRQAVVTATRRARHLLNDGESRRMMLTVRRPTSRSVGLIKRRQTHGRQAGISARSSRCSLATQARSVLGQDIVEENSSVFCVIRMRWLPSAMARGSKTLHQQNPLPVLNWRCRLTQTDLYNGRKTVVVGCCCFRFFPLSTSLLDLSSSPVLPSFP